MLRKHLRHPVARWFIGLLALAVIGGLAGCTGAGGDGRPAPSGRVSAAPEPPPATNPCANPAVKPGRAFVKASVNLVSHKDSSYEVSSNDSITVSTPLGGNGLKKTLTFHLADDVEFIGAYAEYELRSNQTRTDNPVATGSTVKVEIQRGDRGILSAVACGSIPA